MLHRTLIFAVLLLAVPVCGSAQQANDNAAPPEHGTPQSIGSNANAPAQSKTATKHRKKRKPASQSATSIDGTPQTEIHGTPQGQTSPK